MEHRDADRTVVTALHEDDVRRFLTLLGLYDAYVDGELQCAVCARPLRRAGIGAARGGAARVIFACHSLDCLEDFHGTG